MYLRFFLLLLTILFTGKLCAQQEAAIWYFGENAGLDFRSGAPVPLTNGALNTNEGCSTISDFSGNLLFYTDGITVWNRNHIPMPNGNGLMGNPSSTQSGLIVPTPGNPDQFYVFTSGAIEWGTHDVRYSIVDLTLDGGLGDVVQKNTFLFDPSAEKLTAVEHANGTDIWLLTRRSIGNRFYAYRITPAGITTPIISNLGVVLNDGPDSLGYFKVSPDGTKAALVYSDLEVELMDFNTATGQFSNVREIGDGDLFGYYGVEFSPSGRFVYVTNLDGDLFQYDTLAADVKGSKIQLPSNTELHGALQLAIDGKIYISDGNVPTLSVIEDPDVLGIGCNVNYNAIGLAGQISRFGLPPFIQSYFLVSFTAQHFCLGDVTQFNINASEPIISILWDFGDGNTSTIENATHTYATPGDYTVSVTVTTASETKTEIEQITISAVPVANIVANMEVCQPETTYDLDLSSLDTQVLGAQPATDFSINYFASQADADSNTNALAQTTTFNNGTTTVYARISNTQNNLCYDTTSFDVIVKEAPELGTVTDWVVCDDDADGLYTFDLATKNAEVLNGEDPLVFDLAYFPTQADADAATNALPTNYTNTLAAETIFYRVQNSTYPDCFETGSFGVEVIGQVVANQPNNMQACDDNNDGIFTFDLTAQEAQIIGAQTTSSIVISFHPSQTDADANTNALNAGNYTNTTSYQETIYVRVSNTSDASCYDTSNFDVLVFDTPMLTDISDWLICDDNNDGLYNFDFGLKDVEILGTLTATDYMISYHENQTDADTGVNAIAGTYQNTSNPQTIYFRIENNSNTTCSDTGSFAIQVFDEPTASQPSDIIICDTNETGRYQFDLSEKDSEVLNGQDTAIYEVSYHASELDAMNNGNALSSTNYSNIQMNEVVYARVQHSQLTDCYAVNHFSLFINPLPDPGLEEIYVICPDSPDLQIDGGVFESWEWRNNEGSVIGNQQAQNIVELGTYTLAVTQTTNGVVCEKTVAFEVVSSGAPDSFTVDTSGLSDRITLIIDAVGIGDFEYSIDGENYQTDNQFEVFPGSYTVYVRDPFECRTLSQDIVAMGYEKFFTPNGDGIHENWNVIGTELFPEARLYIYDRYGKLLRQISPQGPGWDGSYLGRPLPSSDYWFMFEYGEGEVFTGHFALKR
ncbi:T9SS type B sorting domain-containing protein [Flagellimonas hymeniacidonis]|uniref:T9SS type B sorting domain-containing protein n=1 Tax=Flagellimonas hymeniacidonis TaxID=2603628 RepID=A0A5C8V3I2_9FLAO|nr:T9SS type B sorting domain-containing protein [Flagellimonas hymeniacidonis]TXN36130.1 T9SS type B sorting domain-containing protein [Flagellimonas hymeniacidonis]